MIVKTKNAGEDRHRQMVIADAAAGALSAEEYCFVPEIFVIAKFRDN